MKFRRKSAAESAGPSQSESTDELGPGPWDVADVSSDDVERVDLGSLLLQGEPGRDLRLQVDEASGDVQAVLLAGRDGAMDVRAFAAPRNGDLWSEIRPRIVADMAQRGGTATEREGRFGTELACEVRVQTPDGKQGVQHSRVVGVNGSRWMLRATFIGRPATDPESAADWDECLARVVVRRGDQAVPPGEPLEVKLPDNARKLDRTPPDPKSALAEPDDAPSADAQRDDAQPGDPSQP